MQGPDGRIGYQFKLGDFGLARQVSLNEDEMTPFPSASSRDQNQIYSTRNYGPEDELHDVGIVMLKLREYIYLLHPNLPEYEIHPDTAYQHLLANIHFGECDINGALNIARSKCCDMMDLNYV